MGKQRTLQNIAWEVSVHLSIQQWWSIYGNRQDGILYWRQSPRQKSFKLLWTEGQNPPLYRESDTRKSTQEQNLFPLVFQVWLLLNTMCCLRALHKTFTNMRYRVTHRNPTSFEWVVLRTMLKKNKLCQCVVSTRWFHSAHYKRVNDHCSQHVSRAPHFPFQNVPWPSRSPDLSMCDFFFFGGIWNCVFTLTNPVRWMIWRKPSVRKFVRSIVSCWPMSWMILKKGLKTASKKTVIILPTSFLKLNHLVWHVLTFNFV